VLLEDWEKATVETTAAVVDELVELEDPADAQPDSNASIVVASNHLIAPDLAESGTHHLDVRAGPRARTNTEVQCAETESPLQAQPSCTRPHDCPHAKGPALTYALHGNAPHSCRGRVSRGTGRAARRQTGVPLLTCCSPGSTCGRQTAHALHEHRRQALVRCQPGCRGVRLDSLRRPGSDWRRSATRMERRRWFVPGEHGRVPPMRHLPNCHRRRSSSLYDLDAEGRPKNRS